MSRIGKQPVVVPTNVTVEINDGEVRVKGPLSKDGLVMRPHRNIKVEYDKAAKAIKVTRPNDERQNRALHGLTRSLLNNMVVGVTKGFERRLKVEGIGYQARMDQKSIVLTVGYANAITLTPPDGVTVELGKDQQGKPDASTIVVKGADKQKVGQFAAEVRHARPPEPYKGKGVRYEDEVVRRKEGKSFTSGG
jgi:large subunit ribosomal protein L6